ncbi:MAG: integrase [Gammaproteobacteria bacterium]|nr:integrase [Gammaproteobacteria bacterium]
MTTMINELYDALRKAGVDEEIARKAAQAVLGAEEKEQLVTKDFLRAEMEALKSELIKWNVGAMAVLTGVFAAIVKLT